MEKRHRLLVINLEKIGSKMKCVRLLAWMAVFLGTAINSSVARASDGQPLELNIQMVAGAGKIEIIGGNGLVGIEYTTNLDHATVWSLLEIVQATSNPYFYSDASATNAPKRFYRAFVENSGNTNQPPANPDPQHLVWIKPGTFTMGSPLTELDRKPNEGPQTQVTISQAFLMSKYETTQGEYLAVMRTNPAVFTGDLKRPVEYVSWYDATNYCANLTERERLAGRLPAGYEYRLPTEAEWEYACRAGTTTRFSYGDDLDYTQLGNYAWYDANSGDTTHPVGGKQPNAWGLYDMYGNVWEWCLDWYSSSLPGGSVTDPRGPVTGLDRLTRGGNWHNFGRLCRSADRSAALATSWDYLVGFRTVLAPVQ